MSLLWLPLPIQIVDVISLKYYYRHVLRPVSLSVSVCLCLWPHHNYPQLKGASFVLNSLTTSRTYMHTTCHSLLSWFHLPQATHSIYNRKIYIYGAHTQFRLAVRSLLQLKSCWQKLSLMILPGIGHRETRTAIWKSNCAIKWWQLVSPDTDTDKVIFSTLAEKNQEFFNNIKRIKVFLIKVRNSFPTRKYLHSNRS